MMRMTVVVVMAMALVGCDEKKDAAPAAPASGAAVAPSGAAVAPSGAVVKPSGAKASGEASKATLPSPPPGAMPHGNIKDAAGKSVDVHYNPPAGQNPPPKQK